MNPSNLWQDAVHLEEVGGAGLGFSIDDIEALSRQYLNFWASWRAEAAARETLHIRTITAQTHWDTSPALQVGPISDADHAALADAVSIGDFLSSWALQHCDFHLPKLLGLAIAQHQQGL